MLPHAAMLGQQPAGHSVKQLRAAPGLDVTLWASEPQLWST